MGRAAFDWRFCDGSPEPLRTRASVSVDSHFVFRLGPVVKLPDSEPRHGSWFSDIDVGPCRATLFDRVSDLLDISGLPNRNEHSFFDIEPQRRDLLKFFENNL